MIDRLSFQSARNLGALAVGAACLSGCLMSESEPKNLADVAQENRLSGSVGDGPVIGAEMTAHRNDGLLLAQFQSTSNASYNIMIETESSHYPLIITARGGTDLVTNLAPDFDMRGAVAGPDRQSVANVNPFSTVIAALAEELPGGLTAETLADAQAIVSSALNSGLESLKSSGPMTTHIDEHNIAEVVRASEALAETIRRTRDLLNAAGFSETVDDVLAALASDLTDEVVNGLGGTNTNARAAAVATIVYAQVLMETMANELYVNGSNSQAAMSAAISQVAVRTPTRTIDELRVTGDMIARARVGIAAAIAVDADPRIPELHATVSGLQSGMNSDLVRQLLPADYRSILQNALTAIAAADTATIDIVNTIASGSGDTDPSNRAPVIQGSPPAFVEVNSPYSFVPDSSDPDGDILTFEILNLPPWANFDATTGRLAGTPTVDDIGRYTGIIISVSDGEFSDSLAGFDIDVFQGNAPPVISGTPSTAVTAGQSYVFAPTASDPNGDVLTYSIANQPGWTSFNSATGRLTGAPFESDVGDYADIVISVSDGEFADSLPAFTISVTSAVPPPNTPPTIAGDPPPEVDVGSNYLFTPTATDADGDSLTFSILNRPVWAGFDPATGSLSGIPGDGDVGTYSNIRITVSDGSDTAAMEFAITVNAVNFGSVTLSWTAPTENEDGTVLTDLAGYKIYWGAEPGNYTDSLRIDNPSVTTYVIDNLPQGTYEFAATAFNTSGVESVFSVPTTKAVQ